MGKGKRRKLHSRHETKDKFAQMKRLQKQVEPPKPRARKDAKIVEPVIPFDSLDSILLVGEGDFSFARSLVSHHGCANVVATCFDSEEELFEKYPQAREHVAAIEGECQLVLYGVDATKLSQKQIRKKGGALWDRIVFNFPHVGGKSRDVNRQVRYNQELLVSFFKAAAPLLAPTGSILVTLFENPPYSLWNVRDLARHVGLKVARSFRFQFEAYPEYKHARTLGNLAGTAGWLGEERNARTYIFETSDTGSGRANPQIPKQEHTEPSGRKRRADSSSGEE